LIFDVKLITFDYLNTFLSENCGIFVFVIILCYRVKLLFTPKRLLRGCKSVFREIADDFLLPPNFISSSVFLKNLPFSYLELL